MNIRIFQTRQEAQSALKAFLGANRRASGYVADFFNAGDMLFRVHVSLNGLSYCL